jgi:hypothetical protein
MRGQEEFLNPISQPAPLVGTGGGTGRVPPAPSNLAAELIHLGLVPFSGFVTFLIDPRGPYT